MRDLIVGGLSRESPLAHESAFASTPTITSFIVDDIALSPVAPVSAGIGGTVKSLRGLAAVTAPFKAAACILGSRRPSLKTLNSVSINVASVNASFTPLRIAVLRVFCKYGSWEAASVAVVTALLQQETMTACELSSIIASRSDALQVSVKERWIQGSSSIARMWSLAAT